MKSAKTREASRGPESRGSAIGIDPQGFEPLAKIVDLGSRTILRCALPIFGEFGALQGGVALPGEHRNLMSRGARIDGLRRRRRGLEQPVNALGAGPNSKPGVQLLADRRAARASVWRRQLANDRENTLVGNLLRASHAGNVTVNYGKLKPWRGFGSWNIPQNEAQDGRFLCSSMT